MIAANIDFGGRTALSAVVPSGATCLNRCRSQVNRLSASNSSLQLSNQTSVKQKRSEESSPGALFSFD
jgi:hypothetical protein